MGSQPSVIYDANGSVFVEDGSGASGSCPKSVLGVTSGAGAGASGATGFGRAIGLFGATTHLVTVWPVPSWAQPSWALPS
jgi:hypothetical protein